MSHEQMEFDFVADESAVTLPSPGAQALTPNTPQVPFNRATEAARLVLQNGTLPEAHLNRAANNFGLAEVEILDGLQHLCDAGLVEYVPTSSGPAGWVYVATAAGLAWFKVREVEVQTLKEWIGCNNEEGSGA